VDSKRQVHVIPNQANKILKGPGHRKLYFITNISYFVGGM